MLGRKINITTLFLLFCLLAKGQTEGYVVSLSPYNIGSFEYINAIAQDSTGYIWMFSATGNLIRTDGYNVKKYPYSLSNDDMFSSGYEHKNIFVENNRLWLCGISGLMIFDTETNHYQYPSFDNPIETELLNDATQLIPIEDNTLIVIGHNHLSKLNYIVDNNVVTIKSIEKLAALPNISCINSWKKDDNIVCFSSDMVVTLNLTNLSVTTEHVGFNNYWNILFDEPSGLYIAELRDNQIHLLDSNYKIIDTLNISDDYDICRVNGDYWINEGNGIKMIEIRENRLVEKVLKFTLPSNNNNILTNIYEIFQDISGVVWAIRFDGSVLKFTPDNSYISIVGIQNINHRFGGVIHPFISVSNSVLYRDRHYYQLAFDQLIIYDEEGEPINKIRLFDLQNSMIAVGDTLILVGENSHYCYLMPSLRAVHSGKYYELGKILSQYSTTSLWQEEENIFWFNNYESKIYRIVYDDDNYWHITDILGTNSIKNVLPTMSFKKEGNMVTIYSLAYGMLQYHITEHGISPIPLYGNYNLINEHRISAEVSVDNHQWIATTRGIYIIDRETNEMHKYPPLGDESILSLLEGGDGKIWGTTLNTLFSIDISTEELKRYDNPEDIQFMLQGGTIFDNSNIVFLCNNAIFYRINPNAILLTQNSQKNNQLLAITSIKINNIDANNTFVKSKQIKHGSFVIHKYDYQHNNFSFEFASLDYANQLDIYYKYKLVGFDNQWLSAYSNNRIVEYNNLRPGRYEFIVRASYNASYDEYVEKKYIFKIAPPYWRSTLAYIFYSIVAILVVFYFWSVATKKIRYAEKLKYEEEQRKRERMSEADRKFLENIREYISTNIDNSELSVEDIRNHVGMSHSAFSKRVKTLTDQTCTDIIRIQRMEQAAMLLKSGNMRVSEVCYAVGYNDPKYFYRVFKEHYGVAPTTFSKS